MKRIWILSRLFIWFGIVMTSAIFFVFIPNSGMIWIGKTLDLPPFEITAIFEYMARGMSSLCFFFGIIMLYIGFHFQEHLKLVRFMGWFALLSVPIMIFIHARIDTPIWWKIGDPLAMVIFTILCFLSPRSLTSE
ncbi:MAG: hypothetical protein PHR77_13265 [Kiritimatiellae bacterium]|nr:hypothetical protein [Kiritimatiellia bacterium]MDD5520482.1 hypothetical protein [Kiritimatiellia bacterium]